jgi:hypothetical protein
MFGIVPFQFRFRGKVGIVLDMYYCFLAAGSVGLHPTQIAKETGISFVEVARTLDATPELFVKVPTRAGDVTRYRMTSSASARDPEEVESLLNQYAQRESILLYTFAGMSIAMLVIVVLTIAPNL